ncbi:DUF6414 family protein [Gryllotalpicola ginsengisoli]|uniref:DUF6414 family protein n=1 Tax=Gryllotalpicola ginsengisoli TaxID=444608 RepID=UPI0003B3CE6D|nr:hypothetical protein [Gryllotalpicola ginsengisoli]
MAGYKKPKKKLHRDFLYLDDSVIVNALSAIESGKVDEIIEQSQIVKDAGFDASLGYGPAKIAAKKGRTADITANLVRTRTAFSAFEAWYQFLKAEDALGELTDWNEATRNELEVGDTLEVRARVQFAPVHKLFALFFSYVENANKPDSFFRVPAAELATLKQIANQARSMVKGADGSMANLVYIQPLGVERPLVVGALSENHFVGDKSNMDGEYMVVCQVTSLLRQSETLAAVRAMSDAPRTDTEAAGVAQALDGLAEAGKGLGVAIGDDDKSFTYPTVVTRPLAIYR